VSLRRIDSSRLLLAVADNGVGLPAGFDPATVTSFGMKIVTKLAEQLGAELSLGPGPGARFELVFADSPGLRPAEDGEP